MGPAGCLVVAIALLGCSKRSDEPANAAPGSTAPAAKQIPCTALIPPALFAKYLAGYTLKEHHNPRLVGATCQYAKQNPRGPDYGALGVDVTYQCADNLIAAMPVTLKMYSDRARVDGIGRGAAQIGLGILQFWDDDTNCVVTIGAFANDIAKDPVPFAKDLAAAVTPAVVQ